MRRIVVNTLLIFCICISFCFNLSLNVLAEYTSTSEAYTLVNYLNNKVGESFTSNACQAFVYQSLKNCLGVPNTKTSCCATKAWQNYGVSSSRDDIPLGAAVYFGGSSVTDSSCGQKAGHVGLYVGDGYIVHAWSSMVKKTTIDYVINCGYPYRGWGWQGEYALATETPADPEPPTNCSISANYTSIGVGDIVTFSYNINNATTKHIGIDVAGGSRYASLGVNSDSGTVSYTFTEPGTYCCIVEGSNSWGYNCSSGVYITVISSRPSNCTIKANVNGNISVGDTVTFSYNINGATHKGIGIDSNGSRYFSQAVTSDNGTFSYTFTKSGTYCCIIEGYNNNGYNCSAGINIVVDSLSSKASISSNYRSIGVGDTVTFDYNIIGATEYKGIGIDVAGGSRQASIAVNAEKGKATYTFTKSGTYCCIVEGRTSQEYFCSDGVYVTVIDSAPKNCSIASNVSESIAIGDTVTFEYNIYGATIKGIGIDKAGGSRYDNIGVSSDNGKATYTFTEAGTYCCIIEGYNNVGWNCSGGIYITVEPLSKKCSISAQSTKIAVGDTVKFNYSIDGTTTYKGIGIDIAGGSRYAGFAVNSNSGSTSYTFKEPGTYCCIIEGYNSFDYGCSHGVYIYVNPKYTIYFDTNGGETDVYTKEVVYNFTYGDLPTPTRAGYTFNGWYTSVSGGDQITRDSIVQLTSAQTLYAQWEIATPYTKSTVSKSGNTFNITSMVYNIDETATVIVAGYKNGRFVTMDCVPYNQEEIITTLTGDIDTIKVMVWSDLINQKPLCEEEIITSDEFITQ